MKDQLGAIKDGLKDAPAEVKESYNKVVDFFAAKMNWKEFLKKSGGLIAHFGSNGYELIIQEDGTHNKFSYPGGKDPNSGEKMDRSEIEDRKQADRDAKKFMSGMKKIIRKVNKEGVGTMDAMANAYHGNGPKDPYAFMKLIREALGDDQVVELGENKDVTYNVLSYTNGDIEVELIK